MATLQEMYTRIANELDRQDLLTTEIPQAVATAVQFYQRRNFFFNEDQFTFNTVVGQEYYGLADEPLIATSPKIQILRLQYGNGVRWDLTKQTFEYVDAESASSDWRGVPEDWAYRAQKIRLYPIPSQVWAITAFNIVPQGYPLADPDYAGPWVNDAEYLIRTRSKIELLVNVVREPTTPIDLGIPGAGTGLYGQEERAWANLTAETYDREGLGHAQPTAF